MSGHQSSKFTTQTEIVREIYAALNRNDIPVIFEFFDPQIAHIEFEGLPFGGAYRGHADVKAHFKKARETWAEGSCTPEQFIVAEDRVVVFVSVRVRLKDKVEWNEGQVADVFTFRNGKVIEMRTFAEQQQALEWAGVKDPGSTDQQTKEQLFEPQGGASFFDSFVLLVLAGVLTSMVFPANLTEPEPAKLAFAAFMLAVDVLVVIFVVNTLLFTRFAINEEHLTATSPFFKPKEIQFRGVQAFAIKVGGFKNILLTPRFIFKMKDGKRRTIFCSSKKILTKLRQFAKQQAIHEQDYLDLD